MSAALIIGIDSSIGKILKKTLQESNWAVYGTSRQRSHLTSQDVYLDLSQFSLATFSFEKAIDVVYFCAGISNIAACEQNPQQAYIVNVETQRLLAQYFSERGVHIIYLSSNAVFNGLKPKYKTTCKTCPTTVYGRYKEIVESFLLLLNSKVTIVRLTKVLTPDYPLILNWIKHLKLEEKIFPYPLFLSPISIQMVVNCLKTIAEKKIIGILHLSGEEDVSYMNVAEYLVDNMQLNRNLIQSEALENGGSTSLYASLDMSDSYEIFGKQDVSFHTTMLNLYGHLLK